MGREHGQGIEEIRSPYDGRVVGQPAVADLSDADKALAAAGRLNVLTGPGGRLGDALVSDPRVRKVSFTGSTAVGEHIARTAGVKKLSLELGASCPAVVLPDADVEAAASAIAAAGYINAGPAWTTCGAFSSGEAPARCQAVEPGPHSSGPP